MTLRRLVTDLVDLGTLGAGAYRIHPEPIRVRSFLELCAEPFVARAAAKGIVLETGVRTGAPSLIHADELRLRQVLSVLLDNAVRLTNSGSVSVLAVLSENPPEPVGGGLRQAGAWIELHVADTGPGITEGDQARLFKLFQVLDRPDRAVGAGLSIPVAARWCLAMGGCLRIESDGVNGSTFVVCLPVGQAADPVPVGNPDLSPPMPA